MNDYFILSLLVLIIPNLCLDACSLGLCIVYGSHPILTVFPKDLVLYSVELTITYGCITFMTSLYNAINHSGLQIFFLHIDFVRRNFCGILRFSFVTSTSNSCPSSLMSNIQVHALMRCYLNHLKPMISS